MLKLLTVLLGLNFLSLAAFAKTPFQHILIDGSVARCNDLSDNGSRSFTLKLVESSDQALKFRLETFVCVQGQDKMTRVPYALSKSFAYHNDNNTMSYEYTKAKIVVLNSESTALWQEVAFDAALSSQEISVSTQSLKENKFNLSLQSLEVIKLNGKIFDQGMVFGGSYRISLQ